MMRNLGGKMKIRLTLIAATSLAIPALTATLAHAQPVTGPYISAGVGYNIELKQNLKDGVVGATALPGNANVATQDGYMGQGSFGYGFGDGFRVELEGDYYSNIFSKNPNTNAIPAASGRSTKYGAMVNGLYDFNLGFLLDPYVGAGVGYQEADYNNFTTGGGVSADESKASFAGQAIVGVAFPIAAVPGLSLTGEYRFLALISARKYHGTYQGIDSSFKAQDDYNNSFLLGVRYQLFTPPPPPPPAPMPVAAPAPAPAKTYLVFFDWDKYSLTPRALDIIAQAASDSKTQSTTTIAVNGYTDTSGTPAYNQGLSVRRAKAVEAQLVTDGVPASEITAQGFGDTDLLVPTGPGVREPQNRRVQIVLQ
jgi:outer membrane protein OmpA-like peptidoglycan-associated protein